MLKDMYSVMARINQIQKRFGVMRHNVQQKPAAAPSSTTFEQAMDMVREKTTQPKVSTENIGVKDINKLADFYARQNKISPDLVKAVISQESSYNPRAVSPRGARGLMQLMPSVIKDMNVKDPFAPDENLRAGIGHLKGLLDRYNGDYKKALAAYNAGPAAVDRNNGTPPYRETKDYIQSVLKKYADNSYDK